MKRTTRLRGLLSAWIAAVCLFLAVGLAGAVEPTQSFLDALREAGMFDMALQYIEQMRTSPLADAEFQVTIDYELGSTLIDASRAGRVPAEREKQLDQARMALQKFLAEHADHALAAGAKTRLADLLVERGRILASQAEKSDKSPEEKTQLLAQARALYEQAQKTLTELEAQFLEAHREFPKLIDKKEIKLLEERSQVRQDLLQARLALATVLYEIAKTHPAESEENKKNLTDSAARYGALYKKYPKLLAGLYARMWEGRCYKDLGDAKKAYKVFEELLEMEGEAEAFRTLKAKTLILFLETAMLPAQKKYSAALTQAGKWEDKARGREESSLEGLSVKFLAGEAAFEFARSLGKPEEADARKENLKSAKRYFEFVTRFPGQHQKAARNRLRDKLFVGEDFVRPEPTNFTDARDYAKEALDRTQDSSLSPEEAAAVRTEAINYYRMALRMKTPEVTVEQLNVIRYYLAYLYWMSDELYEASVMGEFLARRYSDGMGAKQGAKIALAAYVKLFNEAKTAVGTAADPSIAEAERDFAAGRMVAVADYITQRWAGEPEADEAWLMLIRTALADGELEKARQYVEKISPDSPRRGEVELMTGQKMWGAYLQAAAKPESQRPSAEALKDMVRQAQETLESGITRMREPVDAGGEVTYTLAASVLSLAQINIGAGQPDKAVVWLEDPKVGVLTLAKADHPVTQRGNFRSETFKAALRAYVATQQIEKAETVMKSLEEAVGQGGDAQAGAKLTRIYISLGRELQDQLERLRNEENVAQLQKVSQSFERFLDRISQRQQGNTFGSLQWVAETFYRLGAGYDAGGKKLSPEAKGYYGKAVAGYRNILKQCEEGTLEPPPGAVTGVKVRLARCLQRLGKFKEARAQLSSVLKERATVVDAQLEAAYTYQSWGEVKPGYYELAIKGSTKYRYIWGFGKLAKRLARSEKHRSMFHEARYNLALSRQKWAMTRKNKTETLKQAEKDILVVFQLYPVKPGDPWYAKYDELLKKIQKLLGKKADGLKVVKRK